MASLNSRLATRSAVCGIGRLFAALLHGRAPCAVLPIEVRCMASSRNTTICSDDPVRIDAQRLLRIRHNLITAPGVELSAIRTALRIPSHSTSAATFSPGSCRPALALLRHRGKCEAPHGGIAKGHSRPGPGAATQDRCERFATRRRRPRPERHALSSHLPRRGSASSTGA